jgi:hypothetical protein
MTESVEFVAKSRFSFKTLFVVLALLVGFVIIQQPYFKGSLAGKNTGNVLLVGISISYFFYRYNLLKVIITPHQVSYGYRKSSMQVIKREGRRFEFDEAGNASHITIIANDEARSTSPVRGFDKAQKKQMISILVQARGLEV